jgi:hypothetical protein
MSLVFGAGIGNRTRISSLEGWHTKPLYDTRNTASIADPPLVSINVNKYYTLQIVNFVLQCVQLNWCREVTDQGEKSNNSKEETPMYQSVLGAAVTVPAAVVLPHTGGNTLLTVTAIVTIAVGAAIIVTSIARSVAKKAL